MRAVAFYARLSQSAPLPPQSASYSADGLNHNPDLINY